MLVQATQLEPQENAREVRMGIGPWNMVNISVNARIAMRKSKEWIKTVITVSHYYKKTTRQCHFKSRLREPQKLHQ